MKTVFCPVKNDQIDGSDCFLVCEAADDPEKKFLLPRDIEWNDAQQEKCLSCPYHEDVK